MTLKYKHLKFIVVFIFILSASLFLWNGFMLVSAGFVRENDCLIINDGNREKIISLLEETVDSYENIPDMKKAVKIEHLTLMHKDQITVYYEDETTYDFFIEYAYENPIALYIENEGYSVYFNSSEFGVDLIKTIIPFITAIASAVVLFTKKVI